MTVKKVKGGYATVHCHGKNKGKIISKFPTKAKAMAQHRAIQINKRKAKHGKNKRPGKRLSAKEQKGLTAKQRRKLPLALRKAIIKKKGRR